jgi:uncharacterized protein (UPF0276 family)
MKLAVNYSPQAVTLLKEGRIQVDYLKCPDWIDLIQQATSEHPVVVHFNLDVGQGEIENVNWNRVAKLLCQTGTPYVNLHLAPTVYAFPGILPERPTPQQSALVLDQILREVNSVVERFGAERVILENNPYYGAEGEYLRTCAEAETIHRILDETGCGFLLDISHATITAHSLGIEARQYIASLPIHRIRELHFSGIWEIDGRLVDHMPAQDADWAMLTWVLERIAFGEWTKPWLLSFEYGGVGERFAWRSDIDVLAEQVPRLYDISPSL